MEHLLYAIEHFVLITALLHSKSKNQVKNKQLWDFPGGAVVKNQLANAGNTGLSPGPGRSHMPRSN